MSFPPKKYLIFLFLVSLFTMAFAQTKVSGTVLDVNTQKPLEGVHIVIIGTIAGTTTDANGKYTLSTDQKPPLTLAYSYLGYRTEEVVINESNMEVDIDMLEEALLGQEIVISASRVRQRIIESPVSVEKMDIRFIEQTASADFYDAISLLKGVQVTNSSLNLTSVNTRGFADAINSRFVQIADGMDTSDPTINANLGSISGISELDIESVELLPGAASALYGPNAFNGMLIMNSKSPFEYEGLSLMTKVGFTNSDAGGSDPLGIYSVRFAKAYNDKIAFKVNLYYLGAQDWTSNDFKTDRNNPESSIDLSNEPNFDGVNLHGDEFPIVINNFGIGTIRRTGIKERILLDNNNARTIKANTAIHYRLNEKLELIGNYKFASGSSLGQSNTKFAYRNFASEFYKLELKADNFFARSYVSITNIDDTYDVGTTGALVNEYFNPSQRPDGTGWVQDYILAYAGAIPNVTPNDHKLARTYADRFMIDPVTGEYAPSFQNIIDEVRTNKYQGNPPGSALYANSYMWHHEIFYDFKQIKWAKVIAGANYRRYNLFSDATVFNEAPDDPTNKERTKTGIFGAYTQISKKITDKLNLTGSIRYDNMIDFKGQFTPRFSAVFSPNKNHSIRSNYQTGFRFPDMIQQFIFFPTPYGIALGGVASTAQRYGVHNGGSWTLESFSNFSSQGGTIDPTTGEILTNPGNVTLETANLSYLKPEKLSSFEIGYNGIIGRNLLVDMNYYHTSYTNFLGQTPVFNKVATSHQGQQIDAGTLWAPNSNSPSTLKSDGFGVSLTYTLPNNFVVTSNYTYTTFTGKQPEGFITAFNTPKNRINLGVSNNKLTKNLGFNINVSYQDDFVWESLYGTATMPTYTLLNAQLNYKLQALKTIVKIGGTNIGGSDYRTSFGSPFIGQTYYISLLFNEMLK